MSFALSPDSSDSSLVQPLEAFYAAQNASLPSVEPVEPEQVPEPYHVLLVHESDMTSTLETYHREPVTLVVLSSHLRDGSYFREVVLSTADTRQPVEFGAIRINLPLFPLAARRLILEERCPLGQILWDCSVPFVSRPQAFLRVMADALMAERLGVPGGVWLYGRRNRILNPEEEILADIVEILPPERRVISLPWDETRNGAARPPAGGRQGRRW